MQNDTLQYEYSKFSKEWDYRIREIKKSNPTKEVLVFYNNLMVSQREKLKDVKDRVKSNELNYTAFEECLNIIVRERKKFYTKFKEDKKNG